MTDSTEKSISDIIASQGAVSVLGKVFRRGSGFVFLALVTRLVSPSTYGQFTLGLTIVLLLRGLSGLGLNRSVDYFIPRNMGDPETIRTIILYALGITVVATTATVAVLAVAAPVVAAELGEPVLRTAIPALAVALPLWGVLNVVVGVFRGIKSLQYLVVSKSIVFPITKILATAGFVVAGLELFGLIGGYLVALVFAIVVALGLLWLVADDLFEETTEAEDDDEGGEFSLRSMVSYSLPLAVAGLIYAVVFQLDYLVIGFFGTAPDVAVYRVAYLLTATLAVVVGPLGQAYKPAVAERSSDRTSLSELYRLTTRWMVMLILPPWLTLVLAPETYVRVLFTTDFAVAGTVLIVLTLGFLTNALGGPEAMMLEGLGYSRVTMANAVVLIVLNLVLDVLLIPRFGVLGAAIATSTALTIRVVAGVGEIYLFRGVHPYGRWLLEVGVAAVPAAVAGAIATRLLPDGVIVAVALPPIVVVSYAGALVLGGVFNEDDHSVAGRVDDVLGYRVFQRVVRP